MDSLLLKPEEAALLLGIGKSKIYELIAQRALPSVRIGKALRVPREDVLRWVQERVEKGGQGE